MTYEGSQEDNACNISKYNMILTTKNIISSFTLQNVMGNTYLVHIKTSNESS